MTHLNPNKLGLIGGTFYALFHALWLVMVATGIAAPFLDWVLSLHSLSMPYLVHSFQLIPALMLVLFTFVFGYFLGWALATIWNKVNDAQDWVHR